MVFFMVLGLHYILMDMTPSSSSFTYYRHAFDLVGWSGYSGYSSNLFVDCYQKAFLPIFIISIDFNTGGIIAVFKFIVVRLFFCSVYGLNFRQKRDNFQDTTTTTVGGKVKTI